MKMHLSQSSGDGAFDGQHGMSLAVMSLAIISLALLATASVEAAIDISSAMAGIDASGIDASEAMPAITGRDIGAKTSPAITAIASRRRMVSWPFTPQSPTKRLGLIAGRS
jgi:hypothetical protein